MMQNNLSWCICKKGQQSSIFIVVEEWAALLCNNPVVKLARGLLEIVSFPPPLLGGCPHLLQLSYLVQKN